MKELHIDIECFSSAELPKSGVYRYVESPDFEILLFGFSADGEPVQVVDLVNGEKIPTEVLKALTDDSVLKFAHNSAFERICLSRFLGMPTGEYLAPDSWRCTMVWAAVMGLPLSLEGVGSVLGLEKQKLTEGKALIKYFCQPCALTKSNGGRTRNLSTHAPDKWADFKRYNARDVEVELAIQAKLSKFPVSDAVWDEYHQDQEINDRGVALDLTLVEEAIKMDGRSRTELTEAMKKLTELGRHRVICGDSTKPETYSTLMGGKQANLILTDPPYGIDYDKGAAGKIKNDKFDSDEGFYKFLHDAFSAMAGTLAADGAAYVFHADSKGLTFRRAFEDAGFKLSGCCIWAKNTFTLGRSDYQWCHEPCLYGWKKSGKHNWYGDRKQSTIWNFDKPSRSEKHPTMKPVPLLAVPMKNSTQTNGVVLDPFGGSGSTLICAEQLAREAYLIELDEKFVDVIVNRYIETVGSADGVFVERDGESISYLDATANA